MTAWYTEEKSFVTALRTMTYAVSTALAIVFTGCPIGKLKKISIDGIDLANARDGQYEGIRETTLIKATVLVTVKDRAITDIVITRHECARGKPAEAIVSRVIERQTTKVDAVTGATGSSMVILDA
ncbi:MAG TPA: FMN-binding protein, partial [Treponemataceae bacterium]|nr:FMN-binding protein [Treponemataceae bacterium]